MGFHKGEVGFLLLLFLQVSLSPGETAKCDKALGLEDKTLPDKSLSASTIYGGAWTTSAARLNAPNNYCWLASRNDMNQWFGVTFPKFTKITKVATQGRPYVNQWVKSYTLHYSLDGVSFQPYKKSGRTAVFTGNSNWKDVKSNIIDPPIIARAVRIHIQQWQGHIAMRLEMYGCTEGFTKPELGCAVPLGVEKDLPATSITASSMYSKYYPYLARLNNAKQDGHEGCWCARNNDPTKYITFDLGKAVKIVRMATQGNPAANQFSKKYTVEHSLNGIDFTKYKNGQEFNGNTDMSNYAVNEFGSGIITRFFRIHITTYYSYACMRVEFYGCDSGFRAPTLPKCMAALGLENGKLPDAAMRASSEANANYRAMDGRLHFNIHNLHYFGWLAAKSDVEQWLGVAFSKWTQITYIQTQGRTNANQWVSSFSLSYSYDGVEYLPYKQNGRTALFLGNKNNNDVRGDQINPPIIARSVRLLPQSWQGAIGLRMELYGCTEGFKIPDIGCALPLGLEDGRIPDTSMIASSIVNRQYQAANGRLNKELHDGRYGAWCARVQDAKQFLQVDFGKAVKAVKVATQGRHDANWWVKTYTLAFSQDGIHFTDYDNGKLFLGNKHRNFYSVNKLIPPIIARYIRIKPKDYHGKMCLRAEFFGCDKGFTPPSLPACKNALGLQNRMIGDSALSASSEYNANYAAKQARLHYNLATDLYYGWLPSALNINQWLQITFTKWTKVSGIATMGRGDHNQYVTSYSLSFSFDTVFFDPYKHNGRTQVLKGNVNNVAVVYHDIEPAIIANAIRILPQAWTAYIGLRVELYGCTKGFEIPKVDCALPLGMQSKDILDKAITASTRAAGYEPSRARLRNIAEGALRSCWRPYIQDKGQWLQVDFGGVAKVTGIATQGALEGNWWTTEYTLSYSLDGGHFEPYKKDFQGNTNKHLIVAHRLGGKPIIARFIRVHPSKWRTYSALRVEFFGCREGFTIPRIPKCGKALGMQSKKIADDKITASSQYNANFKPSNGRLHLHTYQATGSGAWSPAKSDKFQWLQVHFEAATKITRVSTQGRQDANWYVTKYTLSFSQDGIFFEDYQINGETEKITGNIDYVTVASRVLDPPIIAKYIRINPLEFVGFMALRAEFYGCTTGFMPPNPAACRSALGMEKKLIKDAALKASSEYNTNFKVTNGRLNSKTMAWSPKTADAHQWLQVDFGKAAKVTGIATLGRSDGHWWLKSYYLTYSQDGLVYDSYENKKEFRGNLYHNKLVANIIKPAIIARFIRVVPKSWQGHPALRVEFYGCKTGFIAPPPPSCVDPMGLEKGWVPNSLMTASSSYNSALGPYNARLNFVAGSGRSGAWAAAANNVNQWLQVDFERMMLIARVATQGRQDANQWVKTYTLSYSIDGRGKFTEHKVKGKVKVFDGNWNKDTIVINSVNPEIVAQYVRIHPKTWYSHISLRAEFWGCEGAVPIITTPIITSFNGGNIKRRKRAVGSMGARCKWGVRANPIVPGSPPAKYQVQWVTNSQSGPVVNLGNSARSNDLKCGKGGFKAGDDVSCKVRGKFDAKQHWSSYRSSMDFKTGVTVNPTKITVSEGNMAATVTVCTDMPMCCDDPEKEECQVALEFEHMDDIVTNKCQIILKPGQKCTTFKVRAIRDFLDDGNKEVPLNFKPVKAPNCPCWDGYKPPGITVETVDCGHSTCSSNGDPHTATFDRRYYHQLTGGGGTFLFVKSLTRMFEVQAKVWRCWRVLCNCGVAVRENDDVLVFDQCSGVPRVVQKSTGALAKGVSITRHGSAYKMVFRSGAEVTASSASWGIGITVKVPGIDKDNTKGQCGNNNGNAGDDFEGQSQHAFTQNQRVPANRDLFRTIPPRDDNNGGGQTEEKFECECKKKPFAYQECDVKHTGEQKGKQLTPIPADGGGIVPPNGGGGKKRDEAETRFKRGAALTWPTPSGLTEAKVRAECNKVLAESKTGKACVAIGQDISHIIKSCIIDVQVTEMLELTGPSYETMVDECKDAVLRNPANYKANSSKPTAPILDNLCPADCSGHGTCKEGTCTCEKGFYENDCSKDISKPPVLKAMLSSCDVKKWPCKKISIVGDGYVDYEKLSCHMTTLLLKNNKWVAQSGAKISSATYNSFREVYCDLPITYTGNRKFFGPMKVEIMISNDGKTASNKKSLVVFDSRCFSCAANGACKRQGSNCVIDYKCYIPGEKNPANAELVCDPSKSTSSWHDTGVKPTTLAPTNPPTTVRTKAPTLPPLRHRLVGCYLDDWDRAMPDYIGAIDDPDKCMVEVNKRGFKIFGIQNHAECWSGPKAMETYDKHGKETNCKNGVGGPWSNSVYFISRDLKPVTARPAISFARIGCYNDAWNRALTKYLGRVGSVKDCFLKAKKSGFKAFGIQNGHECWSGPNAEKTFAKHGKSPKCKDGMGGPWSNDVYTIQLEGATQPPPKIYTSKLLGCFKDGRTRSLPKHLGSVNSAGQCNSKARANGFKIFGVQNGHECWSGGDTEKTYNRHGISKVCKNNLGGPWANSVYRIESGA